MTSSHFLNDNKRWTDDLPVCKESGVGYSVNCIYRDDGLCQQEHGFENQSFNIKWNENTSMYAIFDGHDGSQVAEWASDTIAAEVLLNQLEDKATDEEVKHVLKNAFDTAEKNCWVSVDDKLTEYIRLQIQITENVTKNGKYKHDPLTEYRLRALHTELSSGTSALVALIHLNRLYVANVGDSRALLCTIDKDNILNVIQLSRDHILSNEIVINRHVTLEIFEEKFRKEFRQGNFEHTRCLGCCSAKRENQKFEELACTSPEPVIAEAEIVGGIALNGCHGFLLLISSGLYQSLEQATGTGNVNKYIAEIVVKQFQIQSTLTGVAQAVVDEAVQFHRDFAGSDNNATINKREDITLIIKNFDFPLFTSKSPILGIVTRNVAKKKLDMIGSATDSPCDTYDSEHFTQKADSESQSKSVHVTAYVDFNPYYDLVEKAKKGGTLPNDIEF